MRGVYCATEYAREIWKIGHTELKTGGFAGGVSDMITGKPRLCSHDHLKRRFFAKVAIIATWLRLFSLPAVSTATVLYQRRQPFARHH